VHTAIAFWTAAAALGLWLARRWCRALHTAIQHDIETARRTLHNDIKTIVEAAVDVAVDHVKEERAELLNDIESAQEALVAEFRDELDSLLSEVSDEDDDEEDGEVQAA
jgi:5'-deoxynucleotidase YfbR-like HD superfamily hydrolase